MSGRYCAAADPLRTAASNLVWLAVVVGLAEQGVVVVAGRVVVPLLPHASPAFHRAFNYNTAARAAARARRQPQRHPTVLRAWLPEAPAGFDFSTAASVFLHSSTPAIAAAAEATTPTSATAAAAAAIAGDEGSTSAVALSKGTATAVFIVGLIPFGIATIEFWRRIAVGASFGTSATGAVVFPPTTTATIGEDGAPSRSRGKQVLGRDALVTAYVLFALAAIVLGIVLFAVLTSPDTFLPPSPPPNA